MIRAVLLRQHFAKAIMEDVFMHYMTEAAGGTNKHLEDLMNNWRVRNNMDHPFYRFVDEGTRRALDGHDILPSERASFKFKLEVVG